MAETSLKGLFPVVIGYSLLENKHLLDYIKNQKANEQTLMECCLLNCRPSRSDMARRNRGNVRDENRRGIAFIAVVLWVLGFADVIMGAINLPANYGVWFLVLAGLLLIISYVFEGL
jgi:hypothetical protein